MDFTSISPEHYYRGSTLQEETGVIFRPYTVSANTSHRIISATNANTALRFNNFVSDGGWVISFSRPFASTGSFTGDIPVGSAAVYGDYAFQTDRKAEADKHWPKIVGETRQEPLEQLAGHQT